MRVRLAVDLCERRGVVRFGSEVVLFDLGEIPMVGNLSNGFAIGLTAEGAALCADLSREDIAPDEARCRDGELFDCLLAHDFFDETSDSQALKVAYLHVTQRCNLNCVGCYSFDESRNALPDASFDQMERTVIELAAAGCESLFVSGGEPFLRPDLPDLIRSAKEAGIPKIVLVTNGTCVSEGVLSRMAPFVDVIAVSFDGYDSAASSYIRGEQRFDELICAVRLVQQMGISAHITPTIHSKNVGDLRRYAELAKSLGATVNYSLLSCEYGDEILDSLIPSEKELAMLGVSSCEVGNAFSFSGAPIGINLKTSNNCGAGMEKISIGADGSVYPCHMLHRLEWVLGNVFEEPLADIVKRTRMRESLFPDVDAIDGCSSCGCRYLCGGGCRARSLFCYGDLHHRDPYCTMMKAHYDKLGTVLADRFGLTR